MEFLAFSRSRINKYRYGLSFLNINNRCKILGSKPIAKDGLLLDKDLSGAMREVDGYHKLAKKITQISL